MATASRASGIAVTTSQTVPASQAVTTSPKCPKLRNTKPLILRHLRATTPVTGVVEFRLLSFPVKLLTGWATREVSAFFPQPWEKRIRGFYEWSRHEVACVIVRRAPPDRTCHPIGSTLRGIAIRKRIV